MNSILVTGANGQLGNCFRQISRNYTTYRFIFTDVEDLDICDLNAVIKYLKISQVDYIINCAAYTAVDKAEDDEMNAMRLNRDAVANLAVAANLVNANIIHISTDYVFNGKNYLPYVETDITDPISVYGFSKYQGEEILKANCPQSIIIRTSWLYSEFGSNFLKTMLRIGSERDELGVIFDQIGTPTYAGDLAQAIMTIIEQTQEKSFIPGIYHYSNEGVASWYDFAKTIFRIAEMSCKVKPLETQAYPTRAMRPHYSVLNKTKIKSTYPIHIPHWEDSVTTCFYKLVNK